MVQMFASRVKEMEERMEINFKLINEVVGRLDERVARVEAVVHSSGKVGEEDAHDSDDDVEHDDEHHADDRHDDHMLHDGNEARGVEEDSAGEKESDNMTGGIGEKEGKDMTGQKDGEYISGGRGDDEDMRGDIADEDMGEATQWAIVPYAPFTPHAPFFVEDRPSVAVDHSEDIPSSVDEEIMVEEPVVEEAVVEEAMVEEAVVEDVAGKDMLT